MDVGTFGCGDDRETFGNSMIYVMPYIYMEGRIRKDGSVLFYVFSASGALKHHEDDWDID